MKNMTSNPPPAADLSPDLNRVPPVLTHIHLMGICGTGMASLAGLLKQQGYQVTGSDLNTYPPMSLFLESLSIPVLKGYDPSNLHPVPDLVIVGNVITRLNPEAIELGRAKIPYLSMPQALRAFAMKGKMPIVICGTHGKTTTSSLAAWLLETAGMDPGFMIGGIPMNFGANFKQGKGPYFVVEGDEYDTAFFDKGPKFLHYAPRVAVLTGIEFDHADIYRDIHHVRQSFRSLVGIIDPAGILIVNNDDLIAVEESGHAKCPCITYGLHDGAFFTGREMPPQDECTRLLVLKGGREYVSLATPVFGLHNIANLLSVVALSDHLGIDPSRLEEAARTFAGVKRRQEIRGEIRGILVLDDFAHHPTAVRETIRAVKDKYRGRRLIAVFEPRSNSSRRNIFQDLYASAFDRADIVMIPEPPLMEKIPEAERFSSLRLVEDLRSKGLQAGYYPDTALLLDELLGCSAPGDVILLMSNGSFDLLPERLLQRLEGLGQSLSA